MIRTTMEPAIVVLRAPGGDPVRLPLWRPAYTRDQAQAHIDNLSLDLDDAHAAHTAGNPAGALVAVRLLRMRSDLRWPEWLAETVLATLEGDPAHGAGGRHARRWTQWREDAADYLRYRAVELLRDRTAEKPDRRIYSTLADRLRAEGGEHGAYGEPRTLEVGYKRVVSRCPAPAPFTMHYHHRYYPDVATLHVLHAADVVKQTHQVDYVAS